MSEGGAFLSCTIHPRPKCDLAVAAKNLAQLKSDFGDGEDLDESADPEGAHTLL